MRALLTLVLAATLAGCKIQMSTTTGGSITTASGNFSCTGGSCTPIDVTDLEFDETFTAEPDPGFSFVGWRKKQRGLCGGSTDSCRLFTSGFAGNNLLLSFLDKDDEVFFLEAVFTENSSAGGGSGTGNASSCWNETLVSPGTTLVASYASSNGSGNLDFNYDQIIESGFTFNGMSALRATSNVTATGDSPSTSVTKAYFQAPGGQRIRSLGVETEVLSPQSAFSTNTLDPFELKRFDLAAGESYVTSFDLISETTTSGQTFSDTTSIERTVRFDGVESVTVPAGTFDACRFTVMTTTSSTTVGTSSTGTDTEWYHVGTGTLLKNQEDDSVTELKSASINGVDI